MGVMLITVLLNTTSSVNGQCLENLARYSTLAVTRYSLDTTIKHFFTKTMLILNLYTIKYAKKVGENPCTKICICFCVNMSINGDLIKFDTRKAYMLTAQANDQNLIIKTLSLKMCICERCVRRKNAETYLKVGRQNFADLNLHISLCRSAFRSALPNADLSFKDCIRL
jgi:hypothetical protein